MTEEKHTRIVLKTVKKWFPDVDDRTAERFSEAIVNRVQTAIELELDEQDVGTVDDFDAIRNNKRAEPPTPVELLPVPPKDSPAPSIIVDPNSEAAREVLADPGRFRAKTPLRLPTRSTSQAPLPGKLYWDQDGLRNHVEMNSPDIMHVQVEGRPDPVPLKRNIEVQLGVNTVKLSYGLDHTNSPSASQPNSPLVGEVLSPISVDTPVAVTLSCEEKFPDLEGKLKQLADMARFVYRPKPEHLASATPRRVGPLTYRTDDPHDEVGPLANRQTGKVW